MALGPITLPLSIAEPKAVRSVITARMSTQATLYHMEHGLRIVPLSTNELSVVPADTTPPSTPTTL